MGKWLPIISRVVTKTIFGDDPDRHWNVVQNNGEYASQTVFHLHFHLIPRYEDEYDGFSYNWRQDPDERTDEQKKEIEEAIKNQLDV